MRVTSASLAAALLSAVLLSARAHDLYDGMHSRELPHSRWRVGNVDQEELTAAYWQDQARSALIAQLSQVWTLNRARNVIMFLGDGMSIPTMTAARILQGQRQNLPGEQAMLSFEAFPHTGLSKTYCVDAQTADSACTSTAYLEGVKANTGTIGVTATVQRGDCAAQSDAEQHVNSIARWAQDAGKAAGIVTTARITHASPAGAYAHIADRDWESDADVRDAAETNDPTLCPDIALQLVTGETGRNLKVVMGGGRKNFLGSDMSDEAGTVGRRADGRNLAAEWLEYQQQRGNASYVWDMEQLGSLRPGSTDYLLGLFADDHMDYHLEAKDSQPRLVNMTTVAIQTLQKEPNGYFLFIEGARIDMGHHYNSVHKALDETIEFSEAVQAAVDLTDESETLIVVTADHAHTMSISGYPARGNDILGVVDLDDNGVTRMTINYANGPSYVENRNISDADDFSDPNFEHPSAQPLSSETHGADDVAVLARGPWGHLFVGVHEQNYIPHAMAFALCVGDGPTACDSEYGGGGAGRGPASTV